MKPFRFAIMGAGGIANKFCNAVKLLDNCLVVAISSKSMERASIFAEKYGIAHAYDSYEQMLIKEKPDCVYVAVTSNAHYELSKLCLKYRIPVLCEKAMFLNHAQAEEIFTLSREKHVFAMEAMWSRFLPAINQAKRWIEDGRIGELVYGRATIGFCAPNNPDNRYFSPRLGGGASYDLLVYCYEIITYLIDRPVELLSANAVLSDQGVDVVDAVMLRFTKEGEEDVLASCESTFLAKFNDVMTIYGRNGRVEIPCPHYASEAYLYGNAGSCIEHFQDEVTQNGFIYEIQEAMACICAGKIESERVPHSLTIECAKVFDCLYYKKG